MKNLILLNSTGNTERFLGNLFVAEKFENIWIALKFQLIFLQLCEQKLFF